MYVMFLYVWRTAVIYNNKFSGQHARPTWYYSVGFSYSLWILNVQSKNVNTSPCLLFEYRIRITINGVLHFIINSASAFQQSTIIYWKRIYYYFGFKLPMNGICLCVGLCLAIFELAAMKWVISADRAQMLTNCIKS